MLVSPFREIEFALLAAWFILLGGSFAYGQWNTARTAYARRLLLLATSALLVVMALVFQLAAGHQTAAARYALFITLGMAASFVGDLIMAEIIHTPQRVLFGILAFGIAHALYILAILGVAGSLHVSLASPVTPVLTAAVLVYWAIWVRSPQTSPQMNSAALGYLFIICLMTGLAVTLVADRPALWSLGIGAFLFLLSDAILANQIFRRNNWPLVSDVVWLLYIAGQALIIWSILAVALALV